MTQAVDLFTQPVPEDELERVEAFARDLAFGVTHGLWPAQFAVTNKGGNHSYWWISDTRPSGDSQGQLRNLIQEKWGNHPPSTYTMDALGYLEFRGTTENGNDVYVLTRTALDLLKRPSTPPNVFISYRRVPSSAFALLIEARLRLVGNPNPFVDKNLRGGDDWHGLLKERIEAAEWFILLIGDGTLESPWVQKELQWARDANCKIVPLCQPGHRLTAYPDDVTRQQGFEILEDSALNYEAAVNFVLNAMGYQTY